MQLYESDGVFMDTLEGFLVGGLRAGDSAIAIATPAHRQALEHRMDAAGLDVIRLKARSLHRPGRRSNAGLLHARRVAR